MVKTIQSMNQVEGCCTVSTEQSGLSLSSAGDAFAVLASPVTRHSRTGAMPSASSQRRSGSPCEGQSSGQLQQSRREAQRTTSGRNSPICQAEQAPRRSTKREQEEQHKRCRTCAKQPFHERCPARLTRPPPARLPPLSPGVAPRAALSPASRAPAHGAPPTARS